MYQKGSNCSLSCWHSKRKGRDDERREQDTVEIISDELEAAEEKEAFDGNDEEFIEEILVPLIRPAAQQLLAKWGGGAGQELCEAFIGYRNII